jgi:hypothetical protein
MVGIFRISCSTTRVVGAYATGSLGNAMPRPRPDHPDFWKLSNVVIQIDAMAEQHQGFAEIVGAVIDIDSVTYMAEQRAIRAMGPNASPATMSLIGATWIDGFMAGINYQKERESSGDTEVTS